MAVARMLRISAVAHLAHLEESVARLQRCGAVQITASEELPAGTPITDEHGQRQVEELLGRTEFVCSFLKRFHEPEQPFSTFISEKVHLHEDEFLSLSYDPDMDELYRECEQLSGRLAEIERERERLKCLRHDLEPWEPLRLQIARWKGTRRVSLFTGTIAASRAERVRQELREAVTELSIEEVASAGPRQAWVVMVVPEHEEVVRGILARTDFEEVSFPGLADYPAEEIAKIDDSLAEYERDEAAAIARAEELAGRYHEAVALVERLRAERSSYVVRSEFGSTAKTFLVEGWLPASRKGDVEAAFEGLPEVDLAFSEPTEEDSPPVVLKNPKWLRPFEVVTDLYGRPRYGDLDPTGALSVWFFFFFGMCLGDVGYGLALTLIAWLIKNKLDVAESVKRFMDLLMYGGVASAIVGVFTGSYFAVDQASLPEALRQVAVLDTVKDVQALLLISIGLGIAQILWGVALKGYRLWREGRVADAVMDEASTILMWAAVPVGFLAGSRAALALLGAVVLMKGHVLVPPFGLKTLLGLFKGLYGLYDTAIGHISDTLSYTRLAALGMASVLVGWVMNLVAGLFPTSGRLAAVGILAAVLVLVVGHALNLVISLLGAFVHPLRLQFVEFFSKFYEGGGRPFSPFDYGTKSLVLHREMQEKGG